jgi:hypothetical protein
LRNIGQQAVEEGLANPLSSFADLLTKSLNHFRPTLINPPQNGHSQ